MIEEHAQVVGIDNSTVWVEAQRQSSCSRCAANKGCGNAVFQKLFGNKQNVFPVVKNNVDRLPVEVGDEVVIGIEEHALVKNSFIVYAMPVLFIIIFGALGETFAENLWSTSKELASIIGALFGLMISVVILRLYNRVAVKAGGSQPVLLRRVDHANQLAQVKILG